MELNKENMRKIRELILFTALLIVVLWKYEEVLEVLGYVGHLIFPFLLGGAIAFVLNVPMNFFQRHLFPEERIEKTRWLKKAARPFSLILVLILAGAYGLWCHFLTDNVIWKKLKINGIAIQGMTKEEAIDAISKDFQEKYENTQMTIT